MFSAAIFCQSSFDFHQCWYCFSIASPPSPHSFFLGKMPAVKPATRKACEKRRRYAKPRGLRSSAMEPSPEVLHTSDPPHPINAVPPASNASTSKLETSSILMAENGSNLTTFEWKAVLLQHCDDALDAPESGSSDACDEPQLLSGYRFVNVTAPLLCPMCHER